MSYPYGSIKISVFAALRFCTISREKNHTARLLAMNIDPLFLFQRNPLYLLSFASAIQF